MNEKYVNLIKQSTSEKILGKRIDALEKREKELLNKLNIYEEIFNSIPINIFLEDREGKTLFANQQACKCNNKTKEELDGKTVFDFFPQEIAENFRNEDLEIWASKKLSLKETVAKFQGKKMHMLIGKTIIKVEKDAYLLGFGLDITNRVTTEKLLKENEKKFRKLVEQAADNFILYDSKGKILDVNTATCHYLGYTREELLRLTYEDIMSLTDEEIKNIYKRIQLNKPFNLEHDLIHRDRVLLPVDTNFGLINLGDKELYLAWSRDISERKKAEKQIKHMAYHDELTGLPNRWYIHSYIEKYIHENRNKEKSLGVFLLDLDNFKLVNDSLGHLAGDQLLQQVASRLKNLFPIGNTLARLGGDEFLLLVPDLNNEDAAISVGTEIKKIMRIPFHIKGQQLKITSSVGISLFPHDGEDISTLLKNADIALYQTKEQGKNGYRLFETTK
ncbi:sensor domain-containing diguanylate cyclase [Bacillaceae bacterium IKA-2]|nr:sensor domain-containing diguanylate cyclase [Bacillaceae bacterium IKA-2]